MQFIRVSLLLATVAIGVVNASPPAPSSQTNEGWSGTLQAQTEDGRVVFKGKVSGSQDVMRYDLNSDANASVVVNLKTLKAKMMLHQLKLAVDEIEDLSFIGLFCGTAEFEKCIKQNGFTFVKKENFSGFPCEVYRGTLKGLKATKDAAPRNAEVTFWRPTTLPHVVSLKTIVRTGKKETYTVTIKDTKKMPLQASVFDIPSDYKSLSGIPTLPFRELLFRESK